MRILMLGWEFPPFIAGGLGTACYGLTRAMDRLGHEVIFVLPKAVHSDQASHIRLLSPADLEDGAGAGLPDVRPEGGHAPTAQPAKDGHRPGADDGAVEYFEIEGFEHVTFRGVPSEIRSPYGPGTVEEGEETSAERRVSSTGQRQQARPAPEDEPHSDEYTDHEGPLPGSPARRDDGSQAGGYAGDMVAQTAEYARVVANLARRERFDVIHAHDWMTYPAALRVARQSGKPLVAHIHSTEYDRSGEHVDRRIHEIERRGMQGALRVIAVSMLTRSICVRRFGIDPEKIDVVYNGIDSDAVQPAPGETLEAKDKIVLFLGRITMQKGPEYFIQAAKRVLEKEPRAKFVVAGSGDMAVGMIEMAARLGIGHRVLFTGFLRGPQVDRVFRMAECYVMPSVSEPFGIAPLEAMRNDTPVIISKQSGVSEVLTHALKVDFWDVNEMANKIVAVLRHPPLGQTLRRHGSFELRRLTWEGAAEKCVQTYRAAIDMQRPAVRA